MTDPQAAPPETDLRAMSDMSNEDLVTWHNHFSWRDGLLATWGERDGHRGDMQAKCDAVSAELLRRLARPDALRERVMVAIDGVTSTDVLGLDMVPKLWVKAAVAAVLEAENAE